MKRIPFLAGFGFLMVLYGILPGVLRAESANMESLLEMPLDQLVQIKVASNIVSDIEKQPVSITVITDRQIRLSGARTLNEVIMTYVPGFFLVEDQDDSIAAFRGLAPDNNSKVMLLLNGHNINTEWFWGPPDAVLNSINLDWIKRIEVIRGPGSVTLGQGALLGVINIVTRTGADAETAVFSGYGKDDFWKIGAQTAFQKAHTSGYMYAAAVDYDGQRLRETGWAAEKGFEGAAGGTVADAGHRLKRAENQTVVADIVHKGFRMDLLYTDQQRDLYNFYRDRDQFRQKLMNLNLEHELSVTENINLTTKASLARDDFYLSTVNGLTTGGTREDRYGLSAVANINDLIPDNRLAIGAEYRGFEFGEENANGDNFIINRLDDKTLTQLPRANQVRTWGYPDDIDVYSFFAEDFYALTPQTTLFAALRYDRHSEWRENVSPRLGALCSPDDRLNFRLSYQVGFRGAPGVHYGGGYKHDGLLRASNFDDIAAAQIPRDPSEPDSPYYENIPQTDPETMHSWELAMDARIQRRWHFNASSFFNIVEDVIDVGVIYADPAEFDMPAIGTDTPGDWNGYWFYKNTAGRIRHYGLEAGLAYAGRIFSAELSHSLVKLDADNAANKTSMYVTPNEHIRAYPEHVTRLNLMISPVDRITTAVNYLYYYSWYSPRPNQPDKKMDGNHILNLSAMINIIEDVELSLVVKNVLDEDELYPINKNAGEESLPDGSPALEEQTFWITLRHAF